MSEQLWEDTGMELECSFLAVELQREVDRLTDANAQLENALENERRHRLMERKASETYKDILRGRISHLRESLHQERTEKKAERQRQLAAIPKFIIAGAAALILAIIPYALEKLNIIDTHLAYAIQCGLYMVIAWCEAAVWERSRR